MNESINQSIHMEPSIDLLTTAKTKISLHLFISTFYNRRKAIQQPVQKQRLLSCLSYYVVCVCAIVCVCVCVCVGVCVAELTAITRVHRWRIVERPLDIEVS